MSFIAIVPAAVAACPDTDTDGDGVCDSIDNCLTTSNPANVFTPNVDSNGDGTADCYDCNGDGACAPAEQDDFDCDGDGDCVAADGEVVGDQCDVDRDGPGDVCDNCPTSPNPDQRDLDFDGMGDACDPTPNGGGDECPTLVGAMATDPSPCDLGLQVSWPPASFPSGFGSYHVYRSELSCADAAAQPPLAIGLTGTAYIDTTTSDGHAYFYAVVAEDGGFAACGPAGPFNGGDIATACAAPVLEIGDAPGCGGVPCDCEAVLLAAVNAADIDVQGVANSLAVKATHACRLLAIGKTRTAGNVFCALLHEIDAQAGRHLPEADADALRAAVLAQAACAGLVLDCGGRTR